MDNIKSHKRKIIAIAILLVIIVLAVSLLPWWRDINITLHGVQLRIGDNHSNHSIEEKTITIQGRYWRYIFRADRFEGRIEIEGYDITLNDLAWGISFPNNSNWGSMLSYLSPYGRRGFWTEHFGRIYTTPWFSSVVITVSEQRDHISSGWSSSDGIIIVAPANNIEQAAEIAKELTIWADYVEWE